MASYEYGTFFHQSLGEPNKGIFIVPRHTFDPAVIETAGLPTWEDEIGDQWYRLDPGPHTLANYLGSLGWRVFQIEGLSDGGQWHFVRSSDDKPPVPAPTLPPLAPSAAPEAVRVRVRRPAS